MTSHVLLISCLMGALSAAGGATTSSTSFSWANLNGKNFLPPMAEKLDTLDESRCFERGINTAMEGAMAAALGEPGYHINLSDQYTFQCGTYSTANCSSVNNYEGVCKQAKIGITDEACVPVTATTGLPKCIDNNCSDINSRMVAASDCNISTNNNESTLKEALLNHGPVAVSMRFFESFKSYTSGIYQKQDNDTDLGIFTVTLVGWEPSTSVSKPETIFIARNDYWGTQWGDKGYFRISLSDKSALDFASYMTWFDFGDTNSLPGHICIDSDTIDLGEVSKFAESNGQAITLRNCGKKTVTWNIKPVAPLQFTPPAGVLAAGADTSVMISVDVNHEKAVDGKFSYTTQIMSQMSHDTVLTIIGSIFAPEEPVVDFTATPYAGYAPLKVQFNNTTKGGEVTKFAWTFGEKGSSSAQENPTYEYVKPGDYTVSLTVTWAGGEITKTREGLIAVYTPKGDVAEDTTREVKTGGCNATSSSDFALWVLMAFFFMLLPQKRLN